MKKLLFLAAALLLIATCVWHMSGTVRLRVHEILYKDAIHELSHDYAGMDIFHTRAGADAPASYIAHGGGVGEFTYTNSREALLDSLEKGFSFIEIDMLVTSDGHIIGGHDWKQFKKAVSITDDSKAPLPLGQVRDLRIQGKYSVLTGRDIADIMAKNRDFILVTDKIRDYGRLMEEIPYPDRMIVEVFSAEDYLAALRAGIRYPAFCIWDDQDLAIARAFRFPIVTMGKLLFERGDTAAVKTLHDAGVTILFFHAGFPEGDDAAFLRQHLGTHISKVYTDRWSPRQLPGTPAP